MTCLTLSNCAYLQEQFCPPVVDTPTVVVTKHIYVTVPEGYFADCGVIQTLSHGDEYEDMYTKFNINKATIKTCKGKLEAIRLYNEEAKKKNAEN